MGTVLGAGAAIVRSWFPVESVAMETLLAGAASAGKFWGRSPVGHEEKSSEKGTEIGAAAEAEGEGRKMEKTAKRSSVRRAEEKEAGAVVVAVVAVGEGAAWTRTKFSREDAKARRGGTKVAVPVLATSVEAEASEAPLAVVVAKASATAEPEVLVV
jgi:hypothetical protein